MATIFQRAPDGLLRAFNIAGVAPTPEEQQRIAAILAGGGTKTAPPPEEELGLGQVLGRSIGRGIDTAQASVFTGLEGLAHAQDDKTLFGRTQDEYRALADEQRRQRDEIKIPEGGFGRKLLQTFGESMPMTAAGITGALGGAAVGAPLGPVGVIGGGLAGGVAAAYPFMFNENIERQIEQHGDVKDYGKAALAAVPQAATEALTDVLTLRVGKVLGKPVSAALKKAVEKGVSEGTTSVIKVMGKTAGVGAVSGAVEEVVQSAIGRWQAEMPLGDEQAQAEYLESAIVGGILQGAMGGAIGMPGGLKQARFERGLRDAKADMDQEGMDVAAAAAVNPAAHADLRRAKAAKAVDKEVAGILPAPEPVAGLLPPPEKREVLPDEMLPPGLRGDLGKPIERDAFDSPDFTEDEYFAAVDKMRGQKAFAADRIKRDLGVGTPKAKALYEAMRKRGDAESFNGYLRVTAPKSDSTNIAGDFRRDYSVKPIEGSKEFGLYETIYRPVDGQEKAVRTKEVRKFVTAQEANEQLRLYDPALGPVSNQRRLKQREQKIERRAEEDARRVLGETLPKLQKLAEKIVGKGRAEVVLKPLLDRKTLGEMGVPEARLPKPTDIIEGVELDAPSAVKRVIALSNDLYSPDLTADQRQKKLEEVLTHELVHALRSLDLLKASEWNALSNALMHEKVPGKSYTWMQRAVARSGGSTKANMLPEEGIAEMMRAYMRDPTIFQKPQRGLLGKLADFIRKLIGLGKAHGADEVARAIFGGEMATREVGSGGLGKRPTQQEMWSKIVVPPFYSKAYRFFEKAGQGRASPEQWLGMMRNAGLKKEELDWLDLDTWFGGWNNQPVPKEKILEYIKANGLEVKLQEDWRGGHLKKDEPVHDIDALGRELEELQPRILAYTDEHFGGDLTDLMDKYWEAVGAAQPGEPLFDLGFNQWLVQREDPVLREFGEMRVRQDEIETILYDEEADGGKNAPKWEEYTQPGGDEYTTAAFYLPHDQFGEDHYWPSNSHYNIVNVVAFTRFKTRTIGGKRTLFIEEIQSDLHQSGSRFGYASAFAETRKIEFAHKQQDLSDKLGEVERTEATLIRAITRADDTETKQKGIAALEQVRADREAIYNEIALVGVGIDQVETSSRVPNAPLKSTWEEFVFKRLLRYAAENGFEQVAWHGSAESVKATEKYPDLRKVEVQPLPDDEKKRLRATKRMADSNFSQGLWIDRGSEDPLDYAKVIAKAREKAILDNDDSGDVWLGHALDQYRAAPDKTFIDYLEGGGIPEEVMDRYFPVEKGGTRYMVGQRNLTAIALRYLEKLPRIAKGIGKKFKSFPTLLGKEVRDAEPEFPPPPTEYELKHVNDLGFRHVYDVFRIDWNNSRRFSGYDEIVEAEGIFEKFRKARQIMDNQRTENVQLAAEEAGLTEAEWNRVYNYAIRARDWVGTVPDEIYDTHGNLNVDRWVMAINEEMRHSLLHEGQPLFSAVSTERMQEIVQNPNFQRWFAGSVVVDDDGMPKVIYHGIRSENTYTSYRHLTHFGTLDAAEDRLAILSSFDLVDPKNTHRSPIMEMARKAGVLPGIDEEVQGAESELRDVADEWWEKLTPAQRHENVWAMNQQAVKAPRIEPVFLSIKNPLRIVDDGGLTDHRDLAWAAWEAGALTKTQAQWMQMRPFGALVKFLEAKGYDGLVYENTVEDSGSDSYVIFHPTQAKSVYNTGSWSKNDVRPNYSAVVDRAVADPKFQTWFEDSKVIDAESRPLVLYHGTAADFEEFREDKENIVRYKHPTAAFGFFFTADPKTANTFAAKSVNFELGNVTPRRYAEGSNLVPVFLKIRNPVVMTARQFGGVVQDANHNRLPVSLESVRKGMQRQGHDGIHIVGDKEYGDAVMGGLEYKNDVWVAFDNRQIKSIFNPGIWGNDPRINYSAVSAPQYSAAAPLGQRVPANPSTDRLAEIEAKITYNNAAPILQKLGSILPDGVAKASYRNAVETGIVRLQDRMLHVGKLIDRMKKNGDFITTENDPYFREQLFAGQVDAAIQNAEKLFYDPLIEAVRKLNVTQASVDQAKAINDAAREILGNYKNNKKAIAELYLYAQHAQERNAVMRERNRNLIGERTDQYEHGSGMSDIEAQEILTWLGRQSYWNDLASLQNPASIRSLFRALIGHTNDVRVEGRLNPDFRTLTRADGRPANVYEDYAPLRGFIDEHADPDEDAQSFAKAGKGYNVRGYEDPSALGRRTIATDLMATAVLQNEEAIIRAGKNKVGLSLVQLIRENPDSTLLRGTAEIIRMTKPKYGLDRKRGVVRRVPNNEARTDPMILTVKEDGKEIHIRFTDARLAEALGKRSSLGNTGAGAVTKALLAVNRFLGATRTSYNPEFMISNMLRDFQAAELNLTEYEMAGLRREVVSSVLPALKGVYKSLRDGNANDPWVKTFHEFKKNGGMTAFMGIRELDDTIRKVNNAIAKDLSGASPSRIKEAIMPLFNLIEDANLAVENGTRLAAYKALRDRFLAMTADPTNPKNIKRAQERAAFAAKNLTVNFNMGGDMKPVTNAFYLFFNASMQGSLALINPLVRSKKVRKLWASVLIAGVVQDVINSLLSPEDDDGEKIYDKIPEWEKEHNIIILDWTGLSDRGYIKIPMPYLMNGIYNAGRAMSAGIRGGYTIGEATNSIVGTMVDSLNPFGSGGSGFLNFVAPTVMDPLVDLYVNLDFTGKPISPPENPFGVDEVASQRYWNNTAPAAVLVSDWISRITGRDGDYLPGAVEISPNTLGYALEFVTGGAGAFASRAWEFGSPVFGQGHLYQLMGGEDVAANDIPGVRRFFGNISERNDITSFIAGRDQIMRVRAELKSAAEAGDRQHYVDIITQYPEEYRLASRVNKIEAQRKKLARRIKQIREAKNISDERKEEMVKRLQEMQDQLVGQGNLLMKDIR